MSLSTGAGILKRLLGESKCRGGHSQETTESKYRGGHSQETT